MLDNIIKWNDVTVDDFVLFHHLPKTAGTALSSGLHNLYGEHNYKWFHGPAGALQEIAGGTALKAAGGHFHLNHSLVSRIDRPLVLITLLREPIDRVVSNYYYLRNNEKHPLHDLATENSLRAIFEKGLSEKLNVVNIMTRMVSTTQVRNKMLSSAKNMLKKYTIFGLQEDTTMLEALLCRMFNTDFVIPKLGAHSKRPPLKDIETNTIQLIQEHNRQDIELYRYAKEVYERRSKEEWK